MDHIVNLNDDMRFKLSDTGKEIALEWKLEPDKEGYYKLQIWEVMRLFGQQMIMTNTTNPFESMEVIIDTGNTGEKNKDMNTMPAPPSGGFSTYLNLNTEADRDYLDNMIKIGYAVGLIKETNGGQVGVVLIHFNRKEGWSNK